ncbi:MAG: hypothetical protein V4696_01510 [Pseudomonadota bacterium]
MAYPLGTGEFISRHEFTSALATIETKITNSELRQRNWVLGGCLAIILAFGGGYMSLVAKLDRLAEAMPAIDRTLEGRKSWMLRQDERDSQQDRALKTVVPDYETPPYVEPPR